MSEEDIKILEKIIKEYRTFGDLDNPEFEDTEKIYNSIENLIKAYKELGELYKSEKKMKNQYVELYQDVLLKENVIPVSLVEEKIEENNKLIEECKKDEEHYGEIYIYEHDNKVLQKLLKDGGE